MCAVVGKYHSHLLEINLVIAFGVSGQRLGVLGQSNNPPLTDDVAIKDELTPWMAVLIGRAQ